MPVILKKTLVEILLDRAKETPDQIAYQFKSNVDSEHPQLKDIQWTFKKFFDECKSFSLGLQSLGVDVGSKIALISKNRIEWPLSDYAILCAHAVNVPLYPSLPAKDLLELIEHSDAEWVIVEDIPTLKKLMSELEKKPDLASRVRNWICFDRNAIKQAIHLPEFFQKLVSLDAVQELGNRFGQKYPGRFEERVAKIQPSSLMSICYTSGTTGQPRGAMITHDQLVSVIEDCAQVLQGLIVPESETVVSLLPYSHIFGRLESFSTAVFGWKLIFLENLDHPIQEISEARPTLLFSVPRFLEKAHLKTLEKIESLSGFRKSFLKWSLAKPLKNTQPLLERGESSARSGHPAFLSKCLAFGRPLFEPWMKTWGRTLSSIKTLPWGYGQTPFLGGKLKATLCGGAPLAEETAYFFEALGVSICEGYGLTETSGPISLNTPQAKKVGSVGRPLPEVQLKIEEDGEIWIKSRKVISHYYKEDAAFATQQGWFATGDIGSLDHEGYLHITDRKKDIIITSQGKNIAPQKIEALAKMNPLIHQLIVHGDRRPYLTALIVLDREKIVEYANANEILYSEYSELIKHSKIQQLAGRQVQQLNAQLAPFESIRKFLLLPRPFSIDQGDLTPSLKIRRKTVGQKYRTQLDELYQN